MYVSRYALLHKAYARFVKNMPEDFSSFCEAEKDWLEDYTLFMALKDANDGKAWGQWDEKLRVRDAAALDEARKKYAEDIEFYKMLQYLFFKQWRELKAYANETESRLSEMCRSMWPETVRMYGQIRNSFIWMKI